MKLENNESMSSTSDSEFIQSDDESISPEVEPVAKKRRRKKVTKTGKVHGKERDDADDDYFRKRIR